MNTDHLAENVKFLMDLVNQLKDASVLAASRTAQTMTTLQILREIEEVADSIVDEASGMAVQLIAAEVKASK